MMLVRVFASHGGECCRPLIVLYGGVLVLRAVCLWLVFRKVMSCGILVVTFPHAL